MDARIALLLEQLQHFPLVEILRHHDRERHDESRIARQGARLEVVQDAGRGITPHGSPTAPAIQARGTRIEQLQVIVQLRHRADGGARSTHRVRLVDGDRGRNALDPIHLRLVHPVQELPRVRRESLDVAPLPLGVDRVEDQRRLAGAGHAGHDDQLPQRDVEVERLQVVLPRAPQANGVVSKSGHVSVPATRKRGNEAAGHSHATTFPRNRGYCAA